MLKFQIKLLKNLNPNSSITFIFKTLAAMSNPSSPTMNKVIKRTMEEVQGERAEQPENQETTLVDKVRNEVVEGEREEDEVRKEVEEVEGDLGGATVSPTDKGAEIFKRILSKKGFIDEKGFKELVPPFKEEIKRRV